jgi:hypothetical protein
MCCEYASVVCGGLLDVKQLAVSGWLHIYSPYLDSDLVVDVVAVALAALSRW